MHAPDEPGAVHAATGHACAGLKTVREGVIARSARRRWCRVRPVSHLLPRMAPAPESQYKVLVETPFRLHGV